jgi:hypothetical protein
MDPQQSSYGRHFGPPWHYQVLTYCMGVFDKWFPPNGWVIMENPLKMIKHGWFRDIVPPFQDTPKGLAF